MCVNPSLSVAMTWSAVRRAAALLAASRISSASGGVMGSGGIGSQTWGRLVGRSGETGVRGCFCGIKTAMAGVVSMLLDQMVKCL